MKCKVCLIKILTLVLIVEGLCGCSEQELENDHKQTTLMEQRCEDYDCPNDLPPARGLINPPENREYRFLISTRTPIDPMSGWVYRAHYFKKQTTISRTHLDHSNLNELVFESDSELEILGIGPNAVYFANIESKDVPH